MHIETETTKVTFQSVFVELVRRGESSTQPLKDGMISLSDTNKIWKVTKTGQCTWTEETVRR